MPDSAPSQRSRKHDVEARPLQRLERAAGGGDAEHARAVRLEAEAQRLADAGIVVDDQHRGGFATHGSDLN